MNISKYVINLKRREDRLCQFKNRCPDNILKDITIVYGFDGKFYENEHDSEKEIFNKIDNKLNTGEKGCFISHLRIYCDLINSTNDYAFIMEDDAIFCHDFTEKYNQVLNSMPLDTKILYIGGRFKSDFLMKDIYYNKITDNIVEYNIDSWEKRNDEQHDRTTHGYIISKDAAKILINCFYTAQVIDNEIDHYIIKMLLETNNKIYSVNPLLCHSYEISDSDIRDWGCLLKK
jgi:GR25 family glycosyltransferase involved in LPS biosynthesis